MSEKTGYKFSVKFNQSLTSGTVAFEGYYAFDTPEDYDPERLLAFLKITENEFRSEGYRVASDVSKDLQKLGDKKK